MPSSNKHPGTILYSVEERPPEWMSILLGFQLVCLIVAPITVTPLVIARMANIPETQISWIIFASLLASGISTWIQVRRIGRIGAGYVLFMGTSGAFIACGLSAAEIGGMALVATMSVISAPFQFLFGWFLGPLRRIITPLVGGVVIMLIVVSVLGIALNLMTSNEANHPPHYPLGVSIITLGTILLLAIFGNRQLRLWSPLIGLLVGTLTASFLGMTNFSALSENPIIGLPEGSWPGFSFDIGPEFFSLYLAFILVTLVGAVETLGDGMAIQRVSERSFRKINYERVQGAIYADGIGNALAGALGTLPNTTYSNAISVVELIGVSSRRVGIYGALFLILLAFSPGLASLIMAVPSPVIGAFLFVLLAMLFVTGMKLASADGLNYESGIIIGISFWVGYAFQNKLYFAELIPSTLAPFLNNGMTVGGLTAIVLSLLFNLRPSGQVRLHIARDLGQLNRLQDFINEYASTRRIPPRQLQCLHLTAEELFAHLCSSSHFTSSELQVLIRLERERLHVEFIDSSESRDLDLTVEEIKTTHSTDPSQLGLLLLGNFAENLRHLTIGGVNYISYEIPR